MPKIPLYESSSRIGTAKGVTLNPNVAVRYAEAVGAEDSALTLGLFNLVEETLGAGKEYLEKREKKQIEANENKITLWQTEYENEEVSLLKDKYFIEDKFEEERYVSDLEKNIDEDFNQYIKKNNIRLTTDMLQDFEIFKINLKNKEMTSIQKQIDEDNLYTNDQARLVKAYNGDIVGAIKSLEDEELTAAERSAKRKTLETEYERGNKDRNIKTINKNELIRANALAGNKTNEEFNEATDAMVGLDPKYTEAWAVKQKFDFTKGKNKKTIMTTLKVDIPKAEEQFNNLDLKLEDQQGVSVSIQQARFSAEKQIQTEQNKTLDDLQTQFKKGELLLEELEPYKGKSDFIKGIKYPLLDEGTYRLLELGVEAQANNFKSSDQSKKLYNKVLIELNDFSQKGKEYFPKVEKKKLGFISINEEKQYISDRIVDIIDTQKRLRKVEFSAVVYQDILKNITIANSGMTKEQSSLFVDINNSFEAVSSGLDADEAITIHLNLLNEFEKNVLVDGISVDEFKTENKLFQKVLKTQSAYNSEKRLGTFNVQESDDEIVNKYFSER